MFLFGKPFTLIVVLFYDLYRDINFILVGTYVGVATK